MSRAITLGCVPVYLLVASSISFTLRGSSEEGKFSQSLPLMLRPDVNSPQVLVTRSNSGICPATTATRAMPEGFRGVHAASIPRTRLSISHIGYADFRGNSSKLLFGIPAILPVIFRLFSNTTSHSELYGRRISFKLFASLRVTFSANW